MKTLFRRLREQMTKPKVNDKLAVKPASREVAYFSYRGLACAININDGTIDSVFEVAKQSLREAMEREEIIDERNPNKAREAVRSEDKQLDSKES